jgi:molybdopterin molybdotransferase
MDGWAVASIEAGLYRIAGESRAGHAFAGPLLPGHAVAISTGAPLPEGAIRVVRREHATAHGKLVGLPAGRIEADVRARACDFDTGDLLARRGDRIDHLCIARLAAGGHAWLPVARQPRIAILTTGDEIVAPGGDPRPDQIFDALSLPVLLRARSAGGQCGGPIHVRDDPAALADAIEGCFPTDILVLIGGASGGRHDHARAALARHGFAIAVPSVLIKPGKPFWCGHNAQGQVAIGLPGNPVAALACVELFLLPLIRAWQGGEPLLGRFDLLAEAPAPSALEPVLFARGERNAQGRMTVELLGGRDSAALSPLTGANLLIRPARGEAIPL